jgi:DNA-binding response OmpR family regulator
MRVFIVEDDPIIVEGLKIALAQENFEVDSFGTMTDAINAVNGEAHYDVCLLDVNLPDGDGYQVCKAIRDKSDVPILFLTACDDEIHTVLALEQGADDYIAKPFRIRELIARIKAIMRRTGRSAALNQSTDEQAAAAEPHADPDIIKVGRNELNIKSGKVKRDGEEIFLSAVEYRLLLTFARSRGQLLTRQQILNDMWDSAGDFVNDNTLTVYVRRLRKKLEQEDDEPVIQTVRGIGYRMD